MSASYISQAIKDFKTKGSLTDDDIYGFVLVINRLVPHIKTVKETYDFLTGFVKNKIKDRSLSGIMRSKKYLDYYDRFCDNFKQTTEQASVFILIKLLLLKKSYDLLNFYITFDNPEPPTECIILIISPYLKVLEENISSIKRSNFTKRKYTAHFDILIDNIIKNLGVIDLETFNMQLESLIEFMETENAPEIIIRYLNIISSSQVIDSSDHELSDLTIRITPFRASEAEPLTGPDMELIRYFGATEGDQEQEPTPTQPCPFMHPPVAQVKDPSPLRARMDIGKT